MVARDNFTLKRIFQVNPHWKVIVALSRFLFLHQQISFRKIFEVITQFVNLLLYLFYWLLQFLGIHIRFESVLNVIPLTILKTKRNINWMAGKMFLSNIIVCKWCFSHSICRNLKKEISICKFIASNWVQSRYHHKVVTRWINGRAYT